MFNLGATFLFVLLTFCALTLLGDDNPTVIATLGQVKGSYLTSASGRKFSAFRGIPYAQPPLGSLRFKVINKFFLIAENIRNIFYFSIGPITIRFLGRTSIRCNTGGTNLCSTRPLFEWNLPRSRRLSQTQCLHSQCKLVSSYFQNHRFILIQFILGR